MPALLTHHIFAEKMVRETEATLPFLAKHFALITLGAQGPDPFFFYGHAPASKREKVDAVNQFGSFLHHEDPAGTLATLIETTRKIAAEKPSDKNLLYSYLFGAITHYVLDCTIHPYVFYRTGFDENEQLTPPYHADHARLESYLDVGMRLRLKRTPRQLNPHQTLSADERDVTKVSTVYDRAYPKFKLGADTFLRSFQDMKKTYRFVYDRFGIKRFLLKVLLGLRSVPVGLSHPSRLNEENIALAFNDAKTPWKNPASSVSSNASVMELFSQAHNLMLQFAELIKRSYDGSVIAARHIEPLAVGINYDGILFSDKMKTFVSLYPAYKSAKAFR